ncbi:transcription factor TCP12-like [Durio zibethinus]|uniref:Transcription factor TCP12-like n=1 Tax=Durio zibethinus TaxID=66656 RepID=A0A6P5XF68_DURZI|nr:transcription factor TCP12-like [Durio zibethinus]
MFPSSNSYNPFPLTTHTMPGSSFLGDKHHVGSSLEDSPHPFWYLPAPFIDDDDDGLLISHLLSQAQQQILVTSSNMAPPYSEVNAASPTKETKKVTTNRKRSTVNGAKQGIPRKRAGKKDRHSKIYTAHGPRDRRMRLSLQTARKFFDLQDMLGFDKASRTIEWLFSQSKAAIKELTENLPGMNRSCSGGGKSVSSTSESEVVSAAKECEDNMGDHQGVIIARGESMRSTTKARETKERNSREVSFNPVARESRDKARARARERTREKMKMRGLEKSKKCSDESNPNELEWLRSSSPLETGENSAPSTQTNSCHKVVAGQEEQRHENAVHLLEHQMDSASIFEKFLGIARATRSSSMFSYSHNNIADSSGENSEENCAVFSGDWGMNNERIQYNYCSMTNIKESTGNAQEQNPSIIFMTDPNGQDHKSRPIFMTQGENPSSNLLVNSYAKIMNHNLMTPSNVAHEGRSPTSILMSTSDIGLHSHYQENSAVASKFHKFYQ